MSKLNKKLLLLGEQPLVDEMLNVCHQHGYECITTKKKHSAQFLAAFELSNINIAEKKNNLEKIEKNIPPSCFIFSSSVTVTTATQATWLKHPERLFGISALPTLLSNSLIELTLPFQTPSSSAQKAKSILRSIGKEISIVQDRIGMVTPRILCMIINEAFFALMEDIASPKDIDLAMKLGTNYPMGPIEWAKTITFKQVCSVLDALHSNLGEERYRIAPLLRQLAIQYP